MKLNSLTRPENLHHCPYGDRREMADICHYVWLRYFDTVRTGQPPCDVMIWEIGPRVSVRPASSRLDESGKKFMRPLLIYFDLRGLAAERRKIERRKDLESGLMARQLAELDGKLRTQMKQAILKGFQQRHVVTGYKQFQGAPLTVVMTSRDDGLHGSEFELIWKIRSGPSIKAIRSRAKANKGKPLAALERKPSIREVRLGRLKEENKQWRTAAKQRMAREQTKVEKRTPGICSKLLATIEKGERQRLQLLKTRARRKTAKAAGFLLSLDDGNQLERRVVPNVRVEELAAIVAKYQWSEFDQYDNRMWEYGNCLMAPALKEAKAGNATQLWLKLNRAQKVFHALLAFIGETDNGGVWQFLFNDPQLSLAALEAMDEIGEAALAGDYKATLEELLGKARTIAEIRRKATDSKIKSQKRWQAFAEGYAELASARKIEKYLFRLSYKKKLYKRISDYVESQFHLLADLMSQE